VTTLAKPLAGGLPLGAMLCTEEAARAIHPGMHGTTFGGGPLACAVAVAVIDTIENDNLLGYVTNTGTYFRSQLATLSKKHSAIIDVRGLGLMLAIELDSADLAKQAVAEMLARHILINRTSETVLRFLPPYVLKKEHIDEAILALDEIFTAHAPQAATSSTIGANQNG
jgi:acetylornithine/N-succinyldiaminopimelate aminotransferase